MATATPEVELVVVGAGPHALALLSRLLSSDQDDELAAYAAATSRPLTHSSHTP
jgi:hypothetical protein